jgi:hypothetical protein
VMIRPLNEQFDPPTVERIRAVQLRVERFPFSDGGGRLVAAELSAALEAGLLFASLQLTGTLLELFLRDLIIKVLPPVPVASGALGLADQLEAELEDSRDPTWTFARLLGALQDLTVLGAEDAQLCRRYYHTVRNAVDHGLTRRLCRCGFADGSSEYRGDLFDCLAGRRDLRVYTMETTLLDEAVAAIEAVVDVMTRVVR